MREIVPPLQNPKWHWIRGLTRYQHLRETEQGLQSTTDRRKDKNSWIADVEVFFLGNTGNQLLSKQGNEIVCYSFRFFGREPVVQTWGFIDDIAEKKAQLAVCFDGKWFLIEKADELTSDAGDEPPFDSITLSVKSRQGHKSVTIYKK